MATNKAKRSNPLAQPKRRSPNPQPKRSQRQINDPQLKSHLFETLSHLNRGFGVALPRLTVCRNKTVCKNRQSSPSIVCEISATALKNFVPSLSVICSASFSDGKTTMPGALAGSGANQKSNLPKPRAANRSQTNRTGDSS